MFSISLPILISTLSLVVLPNPASAWDEVVTIQPREARSGVFGQSKTSFSFDLRVKRPLQGVATWAFSSKGRTIARGEQSVSLAVGETVKVVIPLVIPPVREGVIFPAQLMLSVQEKPGSAPLAQQLKPVWIFPPDPFFDQRDQLKRLPVLVYDPQGDTLRVLQAAKLPLRQVRRAAELLDMQSGMLVIGEGLAWDQHPQLNETIELLAARGVPVLCLAAAGGEFRLPGSHGDQPLPRSLSFHASDIIQKIDQRLDPEGWTRDGEFAGSTFRLNEVGGEILARFTPTDGGWRWLEARYPGQGSLVFCGFGIVKHWEASPAPRFLFARVIEQMTHQPSTNVSQKED